MSESYKLCPICETANHPNTVICTTCGTDLSHVERSTAHLKDKASGANYEFRYGETDLQESSVKEPARVFFWLGMIILLLFSALGLIFLFNTWSQSERDEENIELPATMTNRPTINAITVTQGSPTVTYTATPSQTFTPSATPTQGPCVITLPQGQTLIWALGQCGHRSLDVLPQVLELNDLADAGSIRANQEIRIPRPTPTTDPFATPSATPTRADDAFFDDSEVAQLDESIEAFQATVTPTLPVGIMWHEVQQGQYISEIIIIYNTDVQTLSQLNRQIDFARCDFGDTFGGQDCIVELFQGQLVRVPAPTPTPTLLPTNDPNATATPTATATVNIPNTFSPTDRQFFYNDQLITLRWVPTATLKAGESYRIDVLDQTSNIEYVAYTQDIFYLIPLEWQGNQERHNYQWTVGVVSQDNLDAIRYQTDPLTFVWQGVPSTESN